jgi:hypothetical protein
MITKVWYQTSLIQLPLSSGWIHVYLSNFHGFIHCPIFIELVVLPFIHGSWNFWDDSAPLVEVLIWTKKINYLPCSACLLSLKHLIPP